MLKRIWRISGDIKLSFFLLMLASATLFVGSLYANRHFSLFRELNRVRVQDWLSLYMDSKLELVWWVPVLFVIMGFLGVNTFICAFDRISRLLAQRNLIPGKRFFYLITPSIIHCLFIVIMLGHLLTFTLGKWETRPLESGLKIDIGDKRQFITITEIKNRFYSKNSDMKNRISQTIITIKNSEDKTISLQYVKPVIVYGKYLFLDKIKKRKKNIQQTKTEIINTENQETCNKAHVYLEDGKEKQDGKLLLLIVSDPGLTPIITGLFLVLCLMLWYFLFKPVISKTVIKA